jgi:hypothetical protein
MKLIIEPEKDVTSSSMNVPRDQLRFRDMKVAVKYALSFVGEGTIKLKNGECKTIKYKGEEDAT